MRGSHGPRVHSLRSTGLTLAIAQLLVIRPRHLDVAGGVAPPAAWFAILFQGQGPRRRCTDNGVAAASSSSQDEHSAPLCPQSKPSGSHGSHPVLDNHLEITVRGILHYPSPRQNGHDLVPFAAGAARWKAKCLHCSWVQTPAARPERPLVMHQADTCPTAGAGLPWSRQASIANQPGVADGVAWLKREIGRKNHNLFGCKLLRGSISGYELFRTEQSALICVQ